MGCNLICTFSFSLIVGHATHVILNHKLIPSSSWQVFNSAPYWSHSCKSHGCFQLHPQVYLLPWNSFMFWTGEETKAIFAFICLYLFSFLIQCQWSYKEKRAVAVCWDQFLPQSFHPQSKLIVLVHVSHGRR